MRGEREIDNQTESKDLSGKHTTEQDSETAKELASALLDPSGESLIVSRSQQAFPSSARLKCFQTLDLFMVDFSYDHLL